MKIEVLESTDKVLRFKLTGATYTYANALRRMAINSVACFAIDTITFYENSSVMFDEYVANRVGMIPIITPKGYDEKDEVLFSLDMEGPATVYSKDLKSSDKSVKVADEGIPIIKLAESQRLRLDGKAVMKPASLSAKFQPGLVTYKELSNGQFEFYIETFGQLPPQEIMARALNIISSNLKLAYKEIKK